MTSEEKISVASTWHQSSEKHQELSRTGKLLTNILSMI